MNRKIIFDTVRALLRRGFGPQEIAALDTAIDRALAGEDSEALPALPRRVGSQGLALIKAWEGCARRRDDGLFEAYPDPGTGVEPWTIGWGATGPDIGKGTVWTQDQCDARLEADLTRFAGDVERALGGAPASAAQFDALVSFHYNTGTIARATLTKKHKAGDFNGAAREFSRWVHAGGRALAGLRNRRRAEAALYASG